MIKIYPMLETGGSLYFNMTYHYSRENMYDYCRHSCGIPLDEYDYLSLCHSFLLEDWNGRRWIKQKHMGTLHFCHESINNVGFVAHEAFHAALAWARRRYRKDTIIIPESYSGRASEIEEQICRVAGSITNQIHRKYCREIEGNILQEFGV